MPYIGGIVPHRDVLFSAGTVTTVGLAGLKLVKEASFKE